MGQLLGANGSLELKVRTSRGKTGAEQWAKVLSTNESFHDAGPGAMATRLRSLGSDASLSAAAILEGLGGDEAFRQRMFTVSKTISKQKLKYKDFPASLQRALSAKKLANCRFEVRHPTCSSLPPY